MLPLADHLLTSMCEDSDAGGEGQPVANGAPWSLIAMLTTLGEANPHCFAAKD